MIAELIIYMYLQRRAQEQGGPELGLSSTPCDVWFEPQQSTAPSISCPCTFHLDAFKSSVSCAQAPKGQRLAFSQLLQVFSFFFRKLRLRRSRACDSAGFSLSKADLKTLTLGSRFQVESYPIVGKVACDRVCPEHHNKPEVCLSRTCLFLHDSGII